ncbi:MAG: peptidylprolyl isomerase [Candidatus Acidiferrales bacterium]
MSSTLHKSVFRQALLALLLSAASLFAACRSEVGSDEIWAEVNGQPIYAMQVERYFEREVANLPEPMTSAEEQARKLALLEELIESEILWQKAARAGVQASDAEVEARLREIRAAQSSESFEQQLETQGMTLGDLRAELRRQVAIRKLLDRTFESSTAVTEQEVREHYEQYKNHFRAIETQFRVAHILITPGRDPEVRNLRSQDAGTEEEARRKVQFLLERLLAGDDFNELARNYSEDPTTALAGGDLGFFPESALAQTEPALRSALQRMSVGEVAGPVRTREGYQLLKLVERTPPGQRDFSDPEVQKTIRERLRRQKRQLLEAAYVEQARTQARVVNYLARQILESHHVVP